MTFCGTHLHLYVIFEFFRYAYLYLPMGQTRLIFRIYPFIVTRLLAILVGSLKLERLLLFSESAHGLMTWLAREQWFYRLGTWHSKTKKRLYMYIQ